MHSPAAQAPLHPQVSGQLQACPSDSVDVVPAVSGFIVAVICMVMDEESAQIVSGLSRLISGRF